MTAYAKSFKDLLVYQKARDVSRGAFRLSTSFPKMETQHWVDEALDCGYLAPVDAAHLSSSLEEIGRMLSAMITKADVFCHSPEGTVRDPPAEYFTDG